MRQRRSIVTHLLIIRSPQQAQLLRCFDSSLQHSDIVDIEMRVTFEASFMANGFGIEETTNNDSV